MQFSMERTSLDLVRDTFVSVILDKKHAAALFYGYLFNQAPETRELFRNDLEEQARMFVEALSKIVIGLDQIESLLPELKALAARHVRYGVEERHYAIVGSALLNMVEELSGSAFDARAGQAWREAYTLVSAAMIAASRSDQASCP